MKNSISSQLNEYVLFKELLRQRKEKLQITEELMVEREGEKKQLDKQIEATKRRENYVENKIIETVMFDKPPKKK